MKTIRVTNQDTNDYFDFANNAGGVILRQFDGFEYPEVKSVFEDVSGAPSVFYVTSKFGKRVVSFQGDLLDANVFTLRRNIAKACRQQGRLKLIKFTTYDDLALQFEAEITKLINPYNMRLHQFLIEATAPDWRFYSQSESTLDTESTLVLGGAAIPAELAMDLGSGESSMSTQEVYATNNGNERTEPSFVINGPGTHFVVGNQTTGEEFELDYTLYADEYIEVNNKLRTVKFNGVTNIYNKFSGDWWSLEPGQNQIKFEIDLGYTDATVLQLRWRDAYNGV